jgi:hypothetical protein
VFIEILLLNQAGAIVPGAWLVAGLRQYRLAFTAAQRHHTECVAFWTFDVAEFGNLKYRFAYITTSGAHFVSLCHWIYPGFCKSFSCVFRTTLQA